jgi:chromosome segregation ATPase
MAAPRTPQQLHDQATKGVALSPEEQVRLNEWYAQQDRLENAALLQSSPSADVDELRTQVADALARLAALTRRVQSRESENEAVRKEILTLQQQLAETSTKQPA